MSLVKWKTSGWAVGIVLLMILTGCTAGGTATTNQGDASANGGNFQIGDLPFSKIDFRPNFEDIADVNMSEEAIRAAADGVKTGLTGGATEVAAIAAGVAAAEKKVKEETGGTGLTPDQEKALKAKLLEWVSVKNQ